MAAAEDGTVQRRRHRSFRPIISGVISISVSAERFRVEADPHDLDTVVQFEWHGVASRPVGNAVCGAGAVPKTTPIRCKRRSAARQWRSAVAIGLNKKRPLAKA